MINGISINTIKHDWHDDPCPSLSSSRCDPRLSLGRLYLLPERGGPSGAEDVGAGHPAGPPPRAGSRLWSHGGRSVRQLLWYGPTDQKWIIPAVAEMFRMWFQFSVCLSRRCCRDVQRDRHGLPRHPPHLLPHPVLQRRAWGERWEHFLCTNPQFTFSEVSQSERWTSLTKWLWGNGVKLEHFTTSESSCLRETGAETHYCPLISLFTLCAHKKHPIQRPECIKQHKHASLPGLGL